MSTQVTDLPLPRPGSWDDNVRHAIRALVGQYEARDKPALARAVGMTEATLRRRLKGRGSTQAFVGGEIKAFADFFGVDVADIYRGRVDVSKAPPSLSHSRTTTGGYPRESVAPVVSLATYRRAS